MPPRAAGGVHQRGVVLLEVLCAMVIVSVVGIATVQLVAQHLDAFRQATANERDLTRAHALLLDLTLIGDGATLAPDGSFTRDGFIVETVMLTRGHRLIRLRPLGSARRVVLSTVVYRSDSLPR